MIDKIIKDKDYEKLVNDKLLLKELVLNNKDKFNNLLSNHNSINYCSLIISIFENTEITEENLEDYTDKIFYLDKMFFENLIILEDCIEEILNGSFKSLTNFEDFDDFKGFVEFKDI